MVAGSEFAPVSEAVRLSHTSVHAFRFPAAAVGCYSVWLSTVHSIYID